MASAKVFPASLPLDLERIPKLTRVQAGHIRHFHNLASQPDGSWNHMWGTDPSQEGLESYRYQIANMVYSAGVAHYHRLPALRSVFKPLIRQLIHKMLLRDVWGYWWNTSTGGKFLNPDLETPRKPWADPVVRENIMYSGHLLMMTSLYTMLFDDDEFEKPESIVFDWDPQCWSTIQQFRYSNKTLQDAIIAEMERHQWVGVCCEPNVIFVVCNQFPLIAIRYNDFRNGTKIFDDIIPKYTAAWEKKGITSPSGLITYMWMVQQDRVVFSEDVCLSAWTGAFLNTWNPDMVRSLFERQAAGFITHVDGNTRIQPVAVGNAIRRLVSEQPDAHKYDSAKTLSEAIKCVKADKSPKTKTVVPQKDPTYGFVLQWLSELGEEKYLSGLLDYADKRLQPAWENGGLYYKRCDKQYDEESREWTYMDPYTSNTGIAYGRLNVPGGQKTIFDKPWTSSILRQRPYIDDIDLAKGVDFLRGTWIEEESAVVATFRAWDNQPHMIQPSIKNLQPGFWGIYINGKLQKAEQVVEGSSLSLSLDIPAVDEVDLVVLHAGKSIPN